MTGHETVMTILFWESIGIAAGLLMICGLLLWRSRRTDDRWQHESQVQQRVAELLRREWVDSLPPEARQRLEAQRQHLRKLRAQAEAELAAKARGGRRRA